MCDGATDTHQSQDGQPSSVALVGLGNMGAAIAGRLAATSEPVIFDIDHERTSSVARELALAPAAQLTDLAGAEIVFLSLPHPDASLSVVETLAPLLPSGGVIIETSTVGTGHIEQMSAIAEQHGVGLIDAAIAAGVGQMTAGTAALLVGGSATDIKSARPALDAIAANVYVIGDLGSGAALKVINNAVAHAVMVVLVEAAALAKASGIEREPLIRLMTGTDAGLTRPLEHRLMERIANSDYAGGMPTEAALKDSMLALALAHERAVPLFAISGSHTVYEIANASGHAREDYASIARLWEQWMNTSLGVDDR